MNIPQGLLLETVADIAYLAGVARYYSGDSRADALRFIDWAQEFEASEYDKDDYIGEIERFTARKIKETENDVRTGR